VVPFAVPITITVAFMLTKISFSVGGPGVIIVDPTAFSFPAAVEEALPVVLRGHPARSWVRGASPITFMPMILVSDRVPVTLYPHEIGLWTRRTRGNHAGRWRWTNSDSNRDPNSEYRQGKQ
jgi:hypothetical protein